MAIEIPESHLTQDNNQLALRMYLFTLGKQGTGEIETVRFKNEYDLHSPANSMLIIAFAGFNIDLAVNRIKIFRACWIRVDHRKKR